MGYDDDHDDCWMPSEGWLRDPLGNIVGQGNWLGSLLGRRR